MPSRSRSERPLLTVRRATRADAAALARLARKLNAHQRDPTRHFTKAAILRDGFGRRPIFAALIAKVGRRPVGYALLMPSYETGWAEFGLYLQDLFVEEGMRGHGFGRALIAAAAHEAQRLGGDFLWTSAKWWNRPAQRFYRGTRAVEEPIKAYAWIRRDFARLAREGGTLLAARGRRGGKA